MAGSRQPTDLVKANGRKHLTKTEEAQRRAAEVNLPAAQKATPPRWFCRGYPEPAAKELRAEFRRLGKKLIDAGLYAELDADTLAQYLVARHEYEMAAALTSDALMRQDQKDADTWGRSQDRFFSQARRCAAEMGLSISSRCRLVIPKGMQDRSADETDEFTRALRERQKAAGGL